ncbi:MAG: RNA polymerase sigma factor [Candidatus Azambacteria bacterium]|nr:RNA polymerase sigma factor [Candidatus Azambacteria bacterium]
MEKLSDEQLVELYLTGDREALNLLIRRYLRPIFNLALKYAKDQAAADDLAQEVFVKVWKKIKKYNKQYKFKNWLYAIAKNTCLDYFKKNKVVVFSDLGGADGLLFERLIKETSVSAQAEYELADEAAAINSAVDELPKKYRETIKLHYLGGYKFREIAARLKQSIETVKSRNRRALARLKKIIKK